MQNDDSFNDSDEIFNLYSSKKVTETFKAQFEKLISKNTCMSTGGKNTESIYCGNEVKEPKTVCEEVLSAVNSQTDATIVPDSPIEIVNDNSLQDSLEIIEHHFPRRVTRQSERIRNKRAVSSFNDSGIDGSVVIVPSRSRKKATKHNKKQRKKLVDEIVLTDSPEHSENLEEDELNPEVSVKVIWKSVAIKKFQIRKFQKLSKIFKELSIEEKIPEEKIMLTFNNIKVNPNDTPDSLNLQVYHFLDGGVLSELTNSSETSNLKNSSCINNSVTLKFQDVNKKIVKLTLGKNEKMKVGMIKYSEHVEIPLEKIKFFFDGELVDSTVTPSALGLDNDEIIDIKINI